MSERIDRSENLVSVMSVHPAATGNQPGASVDDWRLIGLLQDGDETAFLSLIESYYSTMRSLAMLYVATRAVAEEVVQEAWVAVLESLHRFEGNSSLKAWIFRILTDCARTRAQREGCTPPFSALVELDVDNLESTVEPEHFRPPDAQRSGDWVTFPVIWDELSEEHVFSQETYVCIENALASLPPNQREIIILRDMEGLSPEEIGHVLNISEGNQRVLLHRARSKVRSAVEKYFVA